MILVFYDWYNVYFDLILSIKICRWCCLWRRWLIIVIDGLYFFINYMMIKFVDKIVFDIDNFYKVIFVKNLLEYFDDFRWLVVKNSFWYLDINLLIVK